jgi:hypothetical protein
MQAMEARDKSSGISPILILTLMLAVLAGIYTAGYFGLSNFGTFKTTMQGGVVTASGNLRTFRHQWLARGYMPAAMIETTITRENVVTGYSRPDGSIEILNR